MMRKYIGILLGMLLLILPLAHVGADDKQDLLLVNNFSNQGEGMGLYLYDPMTNVSTPLLAHNTNADYNSARLSADGRLAYSASIEGRFELDVWDSNHPDQPFVAVMPVGEGDQYALAWSPDGHKLAHQSLTHDGHALIYVWDGKTSVDITPPGVEDTVSQYFDSAWSADGRYLAFETYLDNSYGIYVWDGKTVMDVTPPAADPSLVYYDDPNWSSDDRMMLTMRDKMDSISEIYVWADHALMNLSQNPSGIDDRPAWSADGRVAFLSEHNGVYNVLVWDGVSMKDGLPDTSTFTTIAPEITINLSYPTWTSSGQIAFPGQSPEDAHAQIYVWDGEKATNISQNPTQINANPIWSRDGRWAFTNYVSKTPFLYVRDADNQSVLMTHAAPFKPTWNSNGDLLFCLPDHGGWVLNFWDGQTILEVARGSQIFAQWQSGVAVFCASG